MNPTELSRHANSLGLIFDQVEQEGLPLGSAWLVDPMTVVACAHTVILYKDQLAALKVRFPISGKEFAVRSVTFHPKLDLAHLGVSARRALGEPFVALALEKNNVAVLKIAPGLQPLNPEDNKALNAIFKAERGDGESGLGGNLAEIELALVIQTITNARKEGTVTLIDDRGRVNGRLFCSQGRVTHAYYHNLINEMAVNQIIEHKITGNFYFTSETEPDWTSLTGINRPTDSLMIEAHRRLDELDKLAGIVGGPSSLFERLTPDPRLDVLPADCREFAKLLWPILDGGTPLGFMWELSGIDDYSIYMTLQELIKTRQISYFEAPFVKAGTAVPIQLGTEKALAVGDEISALWIDDPSMAPLARSGKILGTLTEFDPAHVIHTIGLPASASGAPIVKDDVVIGMHCGALPADPSQSPTAGFHQMVWVESIVECLHQAGEKELVKKLTMTGVDPPPGKDVVKVKNPGVREVVRIQCPKCGRSTLELTNFCKGCGHRLIKDQDAPKNKKKAEVVAASASPAVVTKGPSIIWAFVMTALALLCGLGALALIPQPYIVPVCTVTIPRVAWIEPQIEVFDDFAHQWKDALPDQVFSRQKVCIDVHINKPGYFACLYKGTSGETALIFPQAQSKNESRLIGETFSVGSNGFPDKNNLKEFQAFALDEKVGIEEMILLASTAKLRVVDKPGYYDKLVKTALELLERNDSRTGLQTTVDQLGEKFFESGKVKLGDDSRYGGNPVYLTLVQIKHGKSN